MLDYALMAALAYGTKLYIYIPTVGQVDLNDVSITEEVCRRLMTMLEGQCPDLCYHHALENTGVSVGVALASSYVLVHTFSHLSSIQVSLFSERRINLEVLRDILRSSFKTSSMDIQSTSRAKVIEQLHEKLLIGERLFSLAKLDDQSASA